MELNASDGSSQSVELTVLLDAELCSLCLSHLRALPPEDVAAPHHSAEQIPQHCLHSRPEAAHSPEKACASSVENDIKGYNLSICNVCCFLEFYLGSFTREGECVRTYKCACVCI